jgi:hypothetical protein
MAGEPEPMDLPIGCPSCGGKLRATVGPIDPTIRPATWQCPYCKNTHTTDFSGKLYRVVKRLER